MSKKKTATKGKAKASKKKDSATKTKRVVENGYGKGGKTGLVRKMVDQGKNRKQILDKLESLNPDIPRKTNAGLVSITLGKLGKRDIDSGGTPGRKKTIVVKGVKKGAKKKAS